MKTKSGSLACFSGYFWRKHIPQDEVSDSPGTAYHLSPEWRGRKYLQWARNNSVWWGPDSCKGGLDHEALRTYGKHHLLQDRFPHSLLPHEQLCGSHDHLQKVVTQQYLLLCSNAHLLTLCPLADVWGNILESVIYMQHVWMYLPPRVLISFWESQLVHK